jgi:ubiquinone biosynthesis protein UbiJ
MPSTPAWLASAESVLNRSIAASSRARALALRLEGTSLEIDVDSLMRVRAAVCAGRLVLLNAQERPADAVVSGSVSADAVMSGSAPADAVISGSIPALLQLFRGAGPTGQSSAQIRGDAETANLYRQLFTAARPDPEEELSRWVGDIPARQLSRFAQRAAAWLKSTRHTAALNIAEYLTEESRDLVARAELDEFLQGVDEVRETTDRIEARLSRIEQRMPGGT